MCSGEYDNIWNKDYISVIKSKRRSIGIEVHMDGRVILRAPYTLSEKQLEEFVDKHKLWIEEKRRYLGSKARAGISTNAKKKDELTKDEIKCIKEAFEKRVIYYSRIMGVTVKNITIKNQKTRWGSCIFCMVSPSVSGRNAALLCIGGKCSLYRNETGWNL